MAQLSPNRRPSITFPAAIELMEKPVTIDSPLYGSVISRELLKAIHCEHCSKMEDLRFKSVTLQHVNEISNMPESSLLSQVERNGTSCLQCAMVIYEKTRLLLNAPANGELARNTTVHLAARCRGVRTLFHLICLVFQEGGNDMVSRVLRMINKQGETALHQAVKSGNLEMVELLLWMDPGLAAVSGCSSALYDAVCMRHRLIARTLHHWGSAVSFAGPNEKNVMHAAVLYDKDMVGDILKWYASLVKDGDGNGNTPLHLASLSSYDPISDRNLLREYKEAAFQSNARGQFSIHMSASSDQIEMTKLLISQCPKSLYLRDPEGRTILHFAVLNRSQETVSYVLKNWETFASILNARDGGGNTSLHLAVSVEDVSIVSTLLSVPGVLVDILNDEKQTPLDLAMIKCKKLGKFYWEEHDATYIKNSLLLIGANTSCYHPVPLEETCIPTPVELAEDQKLITCSEKMAVTVTSVLIASCTFAASFALPGEVSDDPRICGMFKLAKGPLFSALAVSNWLGFMCSAVATLCSMLAAMPLIQMQYRRFYVGLGYFFTRSSLAALVTTISLHGSISFAPQSMQTAVLIWLGNPAAFLMADLKRWQAHFIAVQSQ